MGEYLDQIRKDYRDRKQFFALRAVSLLTEKLYVMRAIDEERKRIMESIIKGF